MAKLKSDQDVLDAGLKALVDALGYSGAVRFLRHFTRGRGDYLVIQEEIFKGMDLEQIYEQAKEHYERGKRCVDQRGAPQGGAARPPLRRRGVRAV